MDIAAEQMQCVPVDGVTTIYAKREGLRVKVVTHGRMLNAIMVLVTAPQDMETISAADHITFAISGMEDVPRGIITVVGMETGLDENWNHSIIMLWCMIGEGFVVVSLCNII
jgi:hypothetical protein